MFLFVFKAAVCSFHHNKMPTNKQDLFSIIRPISHKLLEYNDAQMCWDVYHLMALQAGAAFSVKTFSQWTKSLLLMFVLFCVSCVLWLCFNVYPRTNSCYVMEIWHKTTKIGAQHLFARGVPLMVPLIDSWQSGEDCQQTNMDVNNLGFLFSSFCKCLMRLEMCSTHLFDTFWGKTVNDLFVYKKEEM